MNIAGPVHICSRNRAHRLYALQAKTTVLLQEAIWQQKADRIGALAVKSLLYEVCTTPKPGLLDRRNSGSHRDMDLFTFMASSADLLLHIFSVLQKQTYDALS